MNAKIRLLATILVIASSALSAIAQQVFRPADSTRNLDARWKWAQDEAPRHSTGDGYWIGYDIRKSMGKHSYIGTFYSDRKKNSPTLADLIGQPDDNEGTIPFSGSDGESFEGTFSMNEVNSDPSVMKKVAILFHYPGGRTGEIDNTIASNLSLHADLGNEPLFWLGNAGDDESIAILHSLYSSSAGAELHKKIIAAVGVHPASEKKFEFLKSILVGQETGSIREEAAFWLGQTNDSRTVALLEGTAEQDNSADVREKALFALSQMDDSLATESLIRLASGNGDRDMRKNAAFWLGQKATRKAITSLRNIVIGSDDLEVEKNALFALSQLPDNSGVDPLINIAQTHTNREIRKQAIFWLSQCDDPRALEAIAKIARN